jgi:hypothetical protein
MRRGPSRLNYLLETIQLALKRSVLVIFDMLDLTPVKSTVDASLRKVAFGNVQLLQLLYPTLLDLGMTHMQGVWLVWKR